MEANDPRGVASLGRRDLIVRISVGDHCTLLHTKYVSCGPCGFREDFLIFSYYKSMGAIYRHGGHLDLRTVTIFTNFPLLIQGST